MTKKKKVSKVVKKKAVAKKAKPVSVTVNVTINPPKKQKVRKNYLMMVLDESSSMSSIKPQAISAFNEQIQTVKNAKGKMDVSVNLVKFANEVTSVFCNEKIENVRNLTDNSFQPNGCTAMYDGVGRAIEMLKAQPDINDPDVTVLVLVISDGAENASKIWSAARVSEELKALQATGRWTVTYAGANQDLAKVSATLNIPIGNMSTFNATVAGMSSNNMLRSVSTKSLYASYNSGDTLAVQSFYNPDPKDTDSTNTK